MAPFLTSIVFINYYNKIMKKFFIIIALLTIVNFLQLNKASAACESCVNINEFNKPKDRYFIKVINQRIKNIKKDLNLIKTDFENNNKINNISKPLTSSNPKINKDYFLNIYLNNYSMPFIRAKKASNSVYKFLKNNDPNIIVEWRSGYYKGYILSLNNYYNDQNEYCTVYAEAILKHYHYDVFKNTACLNSEGNWRDIEKIIVIKDKYKKFKDKKTL